MFTNIDHMAICVKDLNSSIYKYETELQLNCSYREIVEEQGVEVAFFETANVNIELIQPLSPNSPVYKFIEKKGEGLHHIAFRVENIDEAIIDLKKRQFHLLQDTPRKGSHGSKIFFIHPKQFGMLIEIVEKGDLRDE